MATRRESEASSPKQHNMFSGLWFSEFVDTREMMLAYSRVLDSLAFALHTSYVLPTVGSQRSETVCARGKLAQSTLAQAHVHRDTCREQLWQHNNSNTAHVRWKQRVFTRAS